jgi:hypothetical protein
MKEKSKNTDIYETYTSGNIIYGIIIAPTLPIAEQNPNPNVLFVVRNDSVVHGYNI